jgi:hypothetical protein
VFQFIRLQILKAQPWCSSAYSPRPSGIATLFVFEREIRSEHHARTVMTFMERLDLPPVLSTSEDTFTGKSAGCPAFLPLDRGGEESRPYNHIYISRKPRPVPACAKPRLQKSCAGQALRRRQGRGASLGISFLIGFLDERSPFCVFPFSRRPHLQDQVQPALFF